MTFFKNIELGELLEYNGVLYKKKTSITGVMVHNNRLFYFGKNDECCTDKSVVSYLLNRIKEGLK